MNDIRQSAIMDKIVAIATTITAVIALIVAVQQGYEARIHNRQSVKPILNISYTQQPGREGLYINNKGTGPAIIKDIKLYAKQSQGLTEHTNWFSLIQALPHVSRFAGHDIPKGLPISVGEILHAYSLPEDSNEEDRQRFNDALELIDVKIIYESIYGEEFEAIGGLHLDKKD